MGSRVHIFHKITLEAPFEWGVQFGETYNSELWKGEMSKAKQSIEAWENEARAAGILVSSEIDTTTPGSVANAILRRSSTEPCLLAMASQSGPIEAGILGSVTRQLIRQSPSPVWVIHPEFPPEEAAA
jgi:nucleotide-binding universal stress UspA family protein